MTTSAETAFTLCAIYDLGVLPTSFDLAPFLLAAQGEALESGCSSVRLLLVDGAHQGVRFEGDKYEALYPPEMRNWKVSHILQALPRLCPLVERTVSIVPREEIHLYVERYSNILICDDYDGIYLKAWQYLDRYRNQIGFFAPPAAHHYIQNWLASESGTVDKPLVTLTLRESRWSTDRNSDLTVWAEIVAQLYQDGYWPVVVPDTEMAFVERDPEWHTATFCTPAAFDLELRMALYERAQLNIFTNSGPALLAIGSQNCRYLYTGIAHEGTGEAALRRIRPMGMIPGLLPFRPGPYQQWVWEPVTADIVRHTTAVMTQAMRDGILYPDSPPLAVFFDEDYYLAHSPDVVQALQEGHLRTALDHYARVGLEEGRSPAVRLRPLSPAIAAMLDSALQRTVVPNVMTVPQQPDDHQSGFDETYYFQLYPDVAKAVECGQFDSGKQHFMAFGQQEGRFPAPLPAHVEGTPTSANDSLVVYYDITIYPESFDFCFFLLAAEAYRQRIGAGSIQMIIMADADEGWKFRNFSPEDWQKHLKTTAWWRIQHIVIALANMLPTVRDIRVMANRTECERIWQTARNHYPVKKITHDVPIYQAYREALYELYRGNRLILLEAPAAAILYVEQILSAQGLADKRLIVITLREAIFCPERNSNIPAWISLAEELRTAGYAVIIIPDTDTVLSGTTQLNNCALPVNMLAAFNLYIRLAFYQRAYLNLFANGGPFLLAMVGAHTRYMTFIKVVKETTQTDTTFLGSLGFRFGQQTPYPYQRIVDQPDTLENLQREVWGLLGEMDAGEEAPQLEPDANSQSNLSDMGMHYYERGELLQAEACFQQALKVAPDVNILMSLGRVCYDLHRYQEAHKYLQEARRLSPGDMGGWNEADLMAQAKLRRANSTQEVRRA